MGASSLARRVADRRGIDLGSIVGSGPDGKVVLADLAQHRVSRSGQARAIEDFRRSLPVGDIASQHRASRFDVTVEIRLDPLIDLRRLLNAAPGGQGVRITLTSLLVKALATGLRDVPVCNVRVTDIAVVIATPHGIAMPVVALADIKSVSVIATEIGCAVGANQSGTQATRGCGGPVMLANAGMLGVKHFMPVLHHEQPLTLAIGMAEHRVCGDDRRMAASATGSFNRDMIDEVAGLYFMTAFQRIVEAPIVMLT